MSHVWFWCVRGRVHVHTRRVNVDVLLYNITNVRSCASLRKFSDCGVPLSEWLCEEIVKSAYDALERNSPCDAIALQAEIVQWPMLNFANINATTLVQTAFTAFRRSRRRETSPFTSPPSNKNSPNYLESINYRVALLPNRSLARIQRLPLHGRYSKIKQTFAVNDVDISLESSPRLSPVNIQTPGESKGSPAGVSAFLEMQKGVARMSARRTNKRTRVAGRRDRRTGD